jgi:hypothetical protein
MTGSKVNTRTRRTTYVPFMLREGMPVALPLFGPASLTREDAQARVDKAMQSGAYVSGEVREVSNTPRTAR